VIVNHGGQGAGKTYGIAQYIIERMKAGDEIIVSVFGIPLKRLKRDAFRVMRRLMIDEGLDKYAKIVEHPHPKIEFNGSTVEFLTLKYANDAKGPRVDVLWLNEAGEFTLPMWKHLSSRAKLTFMDYNPDMPDTHWIYTNVIKREDVAFVLVTHKDNHLLPESERKDILRQKEVDPEWYRVYGLGLPGKSQKMIYPNWKWSSKVPDQFDAIGVDFGVNSPSSVVGIKFHDETQIYVHQLFYGRKATNAIIASHIPSQTTPVYCDHEGDRIDELCAMGYNAQKARKTSPISTSIEFLSRFQLLITGTSEELAKEIKNYRWRTDRNGNVLDEPVKKNDHAMDAMRYAAYTFEKEYWDPTFV
jgi:phage terminase large subunit